MNIFVLSRDPVVAASMLYDTHVKKMPIESAQMLCIAIAVWSGQIVETVGHNGQRYYSVFKQQCENGFPESYKYTKSQASHPASIWARTSLTNFTWLYHHACEAITEYRTRYDNDTGLLGVENVLDTCRWRVSVLAHDSIPRHGLTPFPLVMPEQYRCSSAVQAYRKYYMTEKAHLNSYTGRKAPSWLKG